MRSADFACQGTAELFGKGCKLVRGRFDMKNRKLVAGAPG
jgi:hypothetical protein